MEKPGLKAITMSIYLYVIIRATHAATDRDPQLQQDVSIVDAAGSPLPGLGTYYISPDKDRWLSWPQHERNTYPVCG